MNRGTFGLLVVLFCIALVLFMASCESKSGQIARQRAEMPVKIVLIKQTNVAELVRQFRVHKVGDSSVYFWVTRLPYQEGDTVSVKLSTLQQ